MDRKIVSQEKMRKEWEEEEGVREGGGRSEGGGGRSEGGGGRSEGGGGFTGKRNKK
jgi:hypothetical protein